MRAVADTTVLITGATDGLGRGVAERLASLGATVHLHGRDPERLAATEREIRDGDRQRSRPHPPRRSRLARAGSRARRRGRARRRRAPRPDQQRRDRQRHARGTGAKRERGRLRAPLRGQLPRGLPSHPAPAAAAAPLGAGADRDRRLARAVADRLRRRHAHRRLRRHPRLQPEQAGADHVRLRARPAARPERGDGDQPPPLDLHADQDGARRARHGRSTRSSAGSTPPPASRSTPSSRA